MVEGRGLAKGNSPERNAFRTPGRADAPSALERVRQAAGQDRKQRFTALLHHVYDVERLKAAYLALKRDAAAGVDGETWRHYGEALADNLRDLAHLSRISFRPDASARSWTNARPSARRQETPAHVPTPAPGYCQPPPCLALAEGQLQLAAAVKK